jgi:hypothetical protein
MRQCGSNPAACQVQRQRHRQGRKTRGRRIMRDGVEDEDNDGHKKTGIRKGAGFDLAHGSSTPPAWAKTIAPAGITTPAAQRSMFVPACADRMSRLLSATFRTLRSRTAALPASPISVTVGVTRSRLTCERVGISPRAPVVVRVAVWVGLIVRLDVGAVLPEITVVVVITLRLRR